MKLPCNYDRLNTCALQIERERVHFAAQIGKMRVAEFGHNQPAPLDMNFDPVQRAREIVQSLISSVQALEPSRMIPLVDPF